MVVGAAAARAAKAAAATADVANSATGRSGGGCASGALRRGGSSHRDVEPVSVPDSGSRSRGGRPRPRGARRRLSNGLHEALHGNATAFGYSVTITASFGAVQLAHGQPRFGDLLLFGVGAVIAFGGLEGLVSRGFRMPLEKGTDQVVTLGTALAFISIALAIATARGVAALLDGGAAWFGAALGASLVFVLVESLEFMLAERVQELRGEPSDES